MAGSDKQRHPRHRPPCVDETSREDFAALSRGGPRRQPRRACRPVTRPLRTPPHGTPAPAGRGTAGGTRAAPGLPPPRGGPGSRAWRVRGPRGGTPRGLHSPGSRRPTGARPGPGCSPGAGSGTWRGTGGRTGGWARGRPGTRRAPAAGSPPRDRYSPPGTGPCFPGPSRDGARSAAPRTAPGTRSRRAGSP